jgi:hypothetical protein
MGFHSPRAFPWERHLPWARASVRESAAVRLQRADRARGPACAKGADASTSRGLGTSATVRIRNACGWSAAGRELGGRPNTAGTRLPKLGMPRQSERAASKPSARLRPLRTHSLRRRVVTQHKLFFPSFMRSARLPRTPCNLVPQPSTLLLFRLPSGGAQCPGPGTQVALARHLGWP